MTARRRQERRQLFGLKNLIGTFGAPWAIINDSAFVDMLPPREKRAGMAEAVKVALIRDGKFSSGSKPFGCACAFSGRI